MDPHPHRPDTVPPGTMIAGRYRVIRHLASGGMGAVYEVVHELTGRRHALKLLYESLVFDEVVIARFTQEARAAASIQSAHVVEVTDMGTEGAAPYLVMELLEGEDLATRLERAGSLSPIEAVDLIGQACEALASAHALGIIHRDIKPGNLFVSRGDFLKVLDFGIAKLRRAKNAVGTGLTRDGSIVGTPEYMSPEQITGRAQLDHRTDIYSLGVILYEMLSGCLPFEAKQLTELAVMIVTSEPAPLSDRARGLPRGLAAVVHDAMEHCPDDRPSDCLEFARRLAPFGSDETFAWADSGATLALHDRSPRLAVTTARFAAHPAAPARAQPPAEPRGDETAPEFPTCDQPTIDLPRSPVPWHEPSNARAADGGRGHRRRLAAALGAGVCVAVIGALGLSLTRVGSADERPRQGALEAREPPLEVPPAPVATRRVDTVASSLPAQASRAHGEQAPTLPDAGAYGARDRRRGARTGARGETALSAPLRQPASAPPRAPESAHVPPSSEDDAAEAPAPHRTPLKTNPFF